jgi:hypothetical protein
MPWCGGKAALPPHHVALRQRVGIELAGECKGSEAARDGDSLVPVIVHRLRGKLLAVALCQLGIDTIPLGLQHAAQNGVWGFLCGRFQLMEGCFGLQCADISSREVEGGKLGDLVGGGIVDAADQHANVAQGLLL